MCDNVLGGFLFNGVHLDKHTLLYRMVNAQCYGHASVIDYELVMSNELSWMVKVPFSVIKYSTYKNTTTLLSPMWF
jgi:hypothetical protein